MKKRLLLILMVLVFAVLPLTGCENSFSQSRLSKKQDTTYIVRGNGGNAVQYGNFIYFINGYRGYEDSDAKNNIWGEVTKGALYRIELLGNKTANDFSITPDAISGYSFDVNPFVIDKVGYEYMLSDTQFDTLRADSLTIETDLNIEQKDNDDYEEDIIEETFYIEDVKYHAENVELVASKVIGTSGYANGGIFIFDNYIYYASPNNDRNQSGTVQTTKTDFFRTDLNGTKTERIYTTSSETSSSPYSFYKQGSYTYLVVLDGTNLVSIKMNNSKVVSRNTIADNATAAYFPSREVYDASNNETNGVEDFVYYTRNIDDEDGAIRTGNAIEVVRPNGKNRFELIKNGKTSSIESVRDGLLFYKTVVNDRTVLRYTNLHTSLLEYNDGNSPYSEQVAGTFLETVSSDYSSLYCFRPNSDVNAVDSEIFVVAFASAAVYIIDSNSTKKILNEQATSPLVHGNRLYYANSSGNYYYISLYESHNENTPQLIEEQGATGAIIRNSVVADYFVFMGTVDSYASAYAKFYPINAGEDATSIFVGERIEADTKQPPSAA